MEAPTQDENSAETARILGELAQEEKKYHPAHGNSPIESHGISKWLVDHHIVDDEATAQTVLLFVTVIAAAGIAWLNWPSTSTHPYNNSLGKPQPHATPR